ncbi:hypothetical protein BB558_006574 [Smittium angustum]|uniref:GIT Spa2 homology (SHD) domain-containing protein n=1 Tax=Smittium angustum TaxID=133377 RepID=A0A2U1IXE7_SMIAN|nr:hypothetical protein BB558_006574 [Smittium angustum]
MATQSINTYLRVMQNFLLDSGIKEQNSSNSNGFRKLERLSKLQFEELSKDVYDELDRRLTKSSDVPFLPLKNNFHPKRNQARQKLATLPQDKFTDLISDIFQELQKRFPNTADSVLNPKLHIPLKSKKSENVLYNNIDSLKTRDMAETNTVQSGQRYEENQINGGSEKRTQQRPGVGGDSWKNFDSYNTSGPNLPSFSIQKPDKKDFDTQRQRILNSRNNGPFSNNNDGPKLKGSFSNLRSPEPPNSTRNYPNTNHSAEIDALKTHIKKLTNDLNNQTETVKNLKGLESEYNETLKTCNDLSKENEELKKTTDNLKNQLSFLKDENSSLGKQLSDATEENQLVRKKIESLERELINLKSSMNSEKHKEKNLGDNYLQFDSNNSQDNSFTKNDVNGINSLNFKESKYSNSYKKLNLNQNLSLTTGPHKSVSTNNLSGKNNQVYTTKLYETHIQLYQSAISNLIQSVQGVKITSNKKLEMVILGYLDQVKRSVNNIKDDFEKYSDNFGKQLEQYKLSDSNYNTNSNKTHSTNVHHYITSIETRLHKVSTIYNQLGMKLETLINATKNHINSLGISPVSLVESAANNVTLVITDFAKLIRTELPNSPPNLTGGSIDEYTETMYGNESKSIDSGPLRLSSSLSDMKFFDEKAGYNEFDESHEKYFLPKNPYGREKNFVDYQTKADSDSDVLTFPKRKESISKWQITRSPNSFFARKGSTNQFLPVFKKNDKSSDNLINPHKIIASPVSYTNLTSAANKKSLSNEKTTNMDLLEMLNSSEHANNDKSYENSKSIKAKNNQNGKLYDQNNNTKSIDGEKVLEIKNKVLKNSNEIVDEIQTIFHLVRKSKDNSEPSPSTKSSVSTELNVNSDITTIILNDSLKSVCKLIEVTIGTCKESFEDKSILELSGLFSQNGSKKLTEEDYELGLKTIKGLELGLLLILDSLNDINDIVDMVDEPTSKDVLSTIEKVNNQLKNYSLKNNTKNSGNDDGFNQDAIFCTKLADPIVADLINDSIFKQNLVVAVFDIAKHTKTLVTLFD